MVLDLTEILTHPGMRYDYSVDEPPLEVDDLVCVQPIQGMIQFANTGSALVLTGRVKTRVSLVCSRCLAPMELSLGIPISEQWPLGHPSGFPAGSVPVVLEEDAPMAGGLFSGPVMDLTELLRQLILLELPVCPIHSEDCLGLCPVCGHDLNMGPCSCVRAAPDSPFAALRVLLDEANVQDNDKST